MTSARAPDLWGLVLAGGASERMGQDKAGLVYHGRTQVRWAHEILLSFCKPVYVSVRPEQAASAVYAGLPLLEDRDVGARGPAAGLLVAWDLAPDVAWLVLAVDLPLVDAGMLGALIAARDTRAAATAFRHVDGVLEPLCTIYEPAARAALREQVPGAASLRRILETASVRSLDPRDPERLSSVNSPADDRRLRARLSREVGIGS